MIAGQCINRNIRIDTGRIILICSCLSIAAGRVNKIAGNDYKGRIDIINLAYRCAPEVIHITTISPAHLRVRSLNKRKFRSGGCGSETPQIALRSAGIVHFIDSPVISGVRCQRIGGESINIKITFECGTGFIFPIFGQQLIIC
jgi:hypothetical protein